MSTQSNTSFAFGILKVNFNCQTFHLWGCVHFNFFFWGGGRGEVGFWLGSVFVHRRFSTCTMNYNVMGLPLVMGLVRAICRNPQAWHNHDKCWACLPPPPLPSVISSSLSPMLYWTCSSHFLINNVSYMYMHSSLLVIFLLDVYMLIWSGVIVLVPEGITWSDSYLNPPAPHPYPHPPAPPHRVVLYLRH